MKNNEFLFLHGWRFKRADIFPISDAIKSCCDKNGRNVYDRDFDDSDWDTVSLPHTFNDSDLFSHRIKDAGGSQLRTTSFYRNRLTVPEEFKKHKIFFTSEGMRQTCYLYVNGTLAGYYEAGVAPFGFDITQYIDGESENVITVVTDNTATRDCPFCSAETPNKSDVTPGSYLLAQDEAVDPTRKGVGFFWNCNDFNPSVGGMSRNVSIIFKPRTYLTLPLYSNLRTRGTYIYGDDFDIPNGTLKVHIDAEVRNEDTAAHDMQIKVVIRSTDGEKLARFVSPNTTVAGVGELCSPKTVVPEDAYTAEYLPDGRVHYIETPEDKAAPTVIDSYKTSVISACSDTLRLPLWSVNKPNICRVEVTLYSDGMPCDRTITDTGFRKVDYDKHRGILINDTPVWLRGYAQRASNEWAAIGIAPQWLKDYDAELIRGSNANHIRFMHIAGSLADVSAYDRYGIILTQPAGDKERDSVNRQWDQRVELMRDIIIAFRNHPSILFWEAGNNSISAAHMCEMRLLKENLDPHGGRYMGCRTLNTTNVINESEYVGTMLNRHASGYTSAHGPLTETEYLREEAPRRVWDDFTPPDFDYRTKWLGKGGRKQPGYDFYDLTSEDLALASARGYAEFFNDRCGGASGNDYYSGCAALCWTDSAQHGRQAFSENARMSGRVDPVRIKKQSYDIFRVMQSPAPAVKLIGHWNYPKDTAGNYMYPLKRFNGTFWEETGSFARRDPKHKTVYAAASYDTAYVELYVNGVLRGQCRKPINTFIFPFENIDITESGTALVKAYNYAGECTAQDKLVTAGTPAALKITAHTAPDGLKADNCDVAFFDIEVLDANGVLCPLCSDRIELSLHGNATLLGGYNSGKFDADNVIHQNHVFAECGTNRVFIRAGLTPDEISLTAAMGDICAECRVISRNTDNSVLTPYVPAAYGKPILPCDEPFFAIPEADAAKYVPPEPNITKVLVNGQEPDTHGVPSRNINGAIWGAVLCIFERIKTDCDTFAYDYSPTNRRITLKSAANTVTAEVGRTHLLVNGKENLMDGEPYISDSGMFVMELSAIIGYIDGVTAYWDDMVKVFRIETK